MKHKRDIEHLCLKVRELLVRTQHHKQIFRRGQRRIRAVNVHTFIVFVVVVSVISVCGKHRKTRNQHYALAKAVLKRSRKSCRVVGGKRQDTPRHRVHNILAGRFHNNIAREIRRQTAALPQNLRELFRFLLRRHFTENEKIRGFLEAKAASRHRDQILDVIPAIPQLAVTGRLNTVHVLESNHLRYRGKSREHALSVDIAKSAVYPVFAVKLIGNCVIFRAKLLFFVRVLSDFIVHQ